MLALLSKSRTLVCRDGTLCGKVPQPLSAFEPHPDGRYGVRRVCRKCRTLVWKQNRARKRRERDRALAWRLRKSTRSTVLLIAEIGTDAFLERLITDRSMSGTLLLRAFVFRCRLYQTAMLGLPLDPSVEWLIVKAYDLDTLRRAVSAMLEARRRPRAQAAPDHRQAALSAPTSATAAERPEVCFRKHKLSHPAAAGKSEQLFASRFASNSADVQQSGPRPDCSVPTVVDKPAGAVLPPGPSPRILAACRLSPSEIISKVANHELTFDDVAEIVAEQRRRGG